MINFKITSLVDGNLTIERPQGTSVLLSPGETVKAEVMNVLPSGSVALKIKGEVITAKTAVPLQQGETAYFKVSDSPSSPKELKLQFIGYEETSQDTSVAKDFMSTPQGQSLSGLIQELSASLLKQSGKGQTSTAALVQEEEIPSESNTADALPLDIAEGLVKQPGTPPSESKPGAAAFAKQGGIPAESNTADALPLDIAESLVKQPGTPPSENQPSAAAFTKQGGIPEESGAADTFPLDKIESLLKALPNDISVLPKDIKTQLQNLLVASLRSTGQSIQSRVETMLNQLPATLKNSPAAESFKADIMLNMEKLLASPLKNALLNTGVALEAKLKSASVQMQFNGVIAEEEATSSAGPRDLQQSVGLNNVAGGTGEELMSPQPDPNVPSEGMSGGAANVPAEVTAGGAKNDKPVHAQSPLLPALKNDLKAMLLELKQRLSAPPEASQTAQDSKAPAAAKETVHDAAALTNLQGKIEGLLKGIETFQALSKTTDSFYTFLPVNWKELKDGDVSFKRGRAGTEGGASSSCRINLDLDNFGAISILVLMHNKDFFVSFKAEKTETDSLVSSNLEELKSSFREKGMSLKAAHVLDKADNSMEHLDKLGSSERIVSIKA